MSAAGALALATALVWQSAYAGFTDTTAAVPLPTVTTGTVALSDDAGGTLFTVSGLKRGDSGTRCISVTSTGTVPAGIRMYATGRSDTNGLASALRLTVRIGTGGGYADCAGFRSNASVYDGTLAAFPTDRWADGLGTWTTSGDPAGEQRTYEITYSLPVNTQGTVQSGSATVTFVWEAQSR
ncbi:hypothetical protein [Modestobacter italicus]|uniref:hypothetical protein n=1 Tax=Modestobacter italicus (strain DSM 44449 / CECT 9708 / BC 501) TaxID=2732864 RepID=UPI001C967D0F|nr:hypothetical protein [Modestobacter italicus]